MLDDHKRVTREGRMIGAELVRLTAKAMVELKAQDEPGECCESCAFRAGTVPNGCQQTQMDALKCVLEGHPFLCHQDPQRNTMCHGWFAARYALNGRTTIAPWEFSPPDDETPNVEVTGGPLAARPVDRRVGRLDTTEE